MFAIAEDNCSGKTMPPLGDVCTVTVSFTPTSIGAKAAQLRFVSNSPQSPYIVSLVGTGVAAVFTADPQSLAFGRQLVGTTSTARVVTIGNAGNKHMSIGPYNVRIKGANADQFTDHGGNLPRGTALPRGRRAPSASCSPRWRPVSAAPTSRSSTARPGRRTRWD